VSRHKRKRPSSMSVVRRVAAGDMSPEVGADLLLMSAFAWVLMLWELEHLWGVRWKR
jgi:hypothetical protein